MLEIKALTKHFGALAAVVNLNLNVNRGKIVGLIGPNGAGKSTVFNLITGFIQPTKGRVIFEQSDITGQKPHTIAEKGIVRTFQDTTFMPDLTVMENILASCYLYAKSGMLEAIFNTLNYRKKEQAANKYSMEILQFLGLEPIKDEIAQNLSLGHQRLLGIAIAMSSKPKLLLLDEPLVGMNVTEVSETLGFINKIRSSGTTVLLVEHNMRAVMDLCDSVVVLHFGRKIAEGPPKEIKRNKNVIEAYLGVSNNATYTQ